MGARMDGGKPVPRVEAWVVFLAVAGLCLVSGLAALRAGRADWDALLALSHAFDVVFKEPRFNLGLMGFSSPPLPTLLYLPLCGFAPSMAMSGLACPVLGAIVLGATAVMLNGIGAACGLPWALRWPLVACLCLHPLVLSLAALGSPGCILVCTVLGAAWSVMRWSATDNLRYLLLSALFLTAALLSAYEAVWLLLAATAYVAWRSYRRGEGWPRVEGTLIAFLLPVLYSAGVWIGANWAIMGDPWHFWRTTALSGRGAPMPLDAWAVSLVWGMLLSFPPIVGLVFHEIRSRPEAMRDARSEGRPAAWLVIGVYLGAIASPGLHSAAGRSTWSAMLLPALAAAVMGSVLLGSIVGQYLRGPRSLRRHVPVGAIGLAVLGIAGALWISGAGGITLPASVMGGLRGDVAFAADISAERATAAVVASSLAAGQTAHVVGWPGYAVSLLAGTPSRILQYPSARLEQLPLRAGDILAIHGAPAPDALNRTLASRGLQAVPLGLHGPWMACRLSAAPPPPRAPR
jgi:hypothetical protein